MAGLNKVILVGNLGKDPEIVNFNNGGKVAKFTLATSESYKDKEGNRVDKTEWHNISVFGKTVDFVEQYIKKGNTVLVEGKLKTSSWEDKKSGEKKYMTEVSTNIVTSIGSKSANAGGGVAAETQAAASAENYMDNKPKATDPAPSAAPVATSGGDFAEVDDDLPF